MSGNHTQLGQTSYDCLVEIVKRFTEIQLVRIGRVKCPRLVKADGENLDDEERQTVKQGLELRKKFGFPFWDAVLVSSFGHPPARNLLQAAAYHQSVSNVLSLPRNDFLNGSIRALCESNFEDEIIVALSEVETTSGDTLHIPMVDFHIPISEENLNIAIEVANKLCEAPFICETDKSYHLISRSLVSNEDLVTFLAKSLFFCPIIDRAYVSHQIIERRCALRIGKSFSGGPCPIVVFA